MRGKEAVLAEKRRTQRALEEVERLRAELATEHAKQADLRAEIGRQKSEHFQEAQAIAAREVKRQLKKVNAERANRKLSDALTVHLTYQKDKLIRNACRYISMTTGEPPRIALTMVLTWCTDKDWVGTGNKAEWFVEMGVPLDGWVARTAQQNVRLNKTLTYQARAISLDRAYDEGHPRIHSDYRDWWYPELIYEGVELVNDDEKKQVEEAVTPAVLAKAAWGENRE